MTNGEDYPADLAAIGIVDDGSTTYQYSVNNGVSPRTYCVTVTVSEISYFISSTTQSPTEGGCAGHGQGGVAAVTNLATNPGFETAGGTVEVRRNIVPNPRMSNSTTGWTVANSAVQTPTSGGTQLDWASVATADSAVFYNSAGRVTAPGEPRSSSLEVAVPLGFPALSMRLDVRSYNSAGAGLSDAYGTTVNVGPGETVRITAAMASAPTNTASVRLILYPRGSGFPAGARLIVRNALIEAATVPGSYFDGAVSGDPDLTSSWTGTPDNSESVLTGANVWRAVMGNGRVVRSSKWSATGSNSARLIPTTDAVSTTMLVADMAGNYGTTLQAGKTYTVVATRHLDAPLTGSLYSTYAGRAILIETPARTTFSDALPNVAGDGTIRWTFTVDAATTAATLRLGHGGSQGSGDVFWDDLMIVEGNYNGPARHGDSPNWIWNGVPHASTSTGPGQ